MKLIKKLLFVLFCLLGFTVEAQAQEWYTIQPGDTLTKLAAQFDTSINMLVAVNNIKNPDLIIAGKAIMIPGKAGGEATSSTEQAATQAAANTGPKAAVQAKVSGVNTKQAKSLEKLIAKAATTEPKVVKVTKLGNNPCSTCTAEKSVEVLGYDKEFRVALLEKVANKEFDIVQMQSGERYKMLSGKYKLEDVELAFSAGHTEPAKRYRVTLNGVEETLIYPFACGNWSRQTRIVPPPPLPPPVKAAVEEAPVAAPPTAPIAATPEKCLCEDFILINRQEARPNGTPPRKQREYDEWVKRTFYTNGP